jgi:hypothetical protein
MGPIDWTGKRNRKFLMENNLELFHKHLFGSRAKRVRIFLEPVGFVARTKNRRGRYGFVKKPGE